ncbi:P-loop containing nucleoside triphosphate hydrolase protein, partial [Coprinopsis marcescibilis]
WQKNLQPDDLQHQGQHNDIVIPVMGLTGVGKSSFINTLTGREDASVGDDLRSKTQKLQAITMNMPAQFQMMYPKLSSCRIVLVDTPGFEDPNVSEYETLRKIAVWLASCYSNNMTVVAGVIYAHDIQAARFLRAMNLNLELFKEICGQPSLPSVILATTKWDLVDQESATNRENNLVTDYWRELVANGAT